MLRTTLIILLLTTCGESLAQTDYARFIDPSKSSEKQRINTGDGGFEEIVYLGAIMNKNGLVSFHVLSVFRLVQAAIDKHGHSQVVFLDKSFVTIKIYSLGLPGELPFMLKDNSLAFYYVDENSKDREIFTHAIGERLPELLCVSPNSCY